MGERQNAILCAFDLKRTGISAYDIHEWIYAQLRLEGNKVIMVQMDGPKRHVYTKLRDKNRTQEVLHFDWRTVRIPTYQWGVSRNSRSRNVQQTYSQKCWRR
jgi:hypothetical protein